MFYLSLIFLLTIISTHAMETASPVPKEQISSLFNAITANNLDEVKELIQHNPTLQQYIDKPQWRCHDKKSPFYVACEQGNIAIAQFFLESGYIRNINDPAAEGTDDTVLDIVVHSIIVAENRKDLTAADNYTTLLRLLCKEYNANINQFDSRLNETLLHKAVSKGSAHLVQELLALGADPCLRTRHTICAGNETALQIAQHYKKLFPSMEDSINEKIALLEAAIEARRLEEPILCTIL